MKVIKENAYKHDIYDLFIEVNNLMKKRANFENVGLSALFTVATKMFCFKIAKVNQLI